MAQQIKKKFIAPDAVGASQLLIEEGQSVRVQDGVNVLDLVKYDAVAGKMKVLGSHVAAYVSDVDAEKSRAEAAEVALGARIDAVVSNVDPAALDSLSEVVAAFQDADASLNGAITSLSNAATSGLQQEITDRQAADTTLDGKITTEAQSRESADTALGLRIDGEASARDAADLILAGQISQETTDRQTALALKLDLSGGTMSGDIDMGAKNLINVGAAKVNFVRNKADEPALNLVARNLVDASGTAMFSWNNGALTALGHKIGNVASAELVGEAVNKGQMDQAIGAASVTANAYVDQVVGQEITNREAAVLAEKTRAESAESALGVRIDNILSNVDAAALDSLTEVVAAFQAADSSLNSAITSLASTASSGLAAEQAARAAADALLQTAMDDLTVYAQDIRGDLDQELIDRAAGDGALDVRVTALEANSGPTFESESLVVTTPVPAYMDLAHDVIAKSLNVFVDHLALHQGVHYSVSVVAGKTRLTWMGDFAVGGAEAIAVGDNIYVNYAYRA